MNRSTAFGSQQHRKNIGRRIRRINAVDFFNVLTGPELLGSTEAHLPEHRERMYPPTVTLSMFMKQGLEEDGSCQKAVNGWVAQRVAEGLNALSVSTGAYCKARQRLPIEMVRALTRETGQWLVRQAAGQWHWRERTVKLVDGTGISMPDTPDNQKYFPQPSSQAEGVGLPLARLVGVICLSTGAVLDAAIGPFEGKGHSELDLFRRLLGAFSPSDVMLADALFCNYFLIATLQGAGVDVLFEQHGARISDFRRGKKLGERDHVVSWLKPKTPPAWMTREQYEAFADEITVREAKIGGQVLVTTLLNERKVSKGELSQLYGRRWNVELDLRNIKTTLGMEVLSCQTPRMNEKQIWVYLLAYNLIRLLMAQAALAAGLHPRQLSFKHTVQIWTEWTTRGLLSDPEQHNVLLGLIAQRKVGTRPGRIEPRARKRRPKPYPLLTTPRALAREQIRIHGHL
ncbi:MAG TPA: IS4 family transposase [Gammaproteobacteria bacterium]|nr:IS4 family transposase [Gammaproteobacteria bacterium]